MKIIDLAGNATDDKSNHYIDIFFEKYMKLGRDLFILLAQT